MDDTSKMDVDLSLSENLTDEKKGNKYSPSPSQLKSNSESETLVYGQLIVLGTNGELPGGDKGRRKSCFTLKKKSKPTGVKPSDQHQILSNASLSQAFSSKEHHSVSYTLSRRVVVVPYVPDSDTDMFQIGRSTEGQIDFVVMDILAGASLPTHRKENQPQQSTISR